MNKQIIVRNRLGYCLYEVLHVVSVAFLGVHEFQKILVWGLATLNCLFVNVCAWRSMIAWCPIQCVFLPHTLMML